MGLHTFLTAPGAVQTTADDHRAAELLLGLGHTIPAAENPEEQLEEKQGGTCNLLLLL